MIDYKFEKPSELTLYPPTPQLKASINQVLVEILSNSAFTLNYIGQVSGRESSVLASAINSVGELITANLNTSAKTILGDFTFGESGAIKMITDADNGLWISPTGILGKKAGVTTFAIDTSGNATFAGTLSAAAGTLGTITAGTLTGLTITGGTIQTATSGQRVVITGATNDIKFYNSGGANVGSIFGDSSGQANVWVQAESGNNLILNTVHTSYATIFQINSATIAYITTAGLTISSGKILNAVDGKLKLPVGTNLY